MDILEIVAATFSPKLPDGRFIFRPWGPVGPCYLLTARQRTGRAWVQLAYYALGFGAASVLPDVPALNRATAVFLATFVAINYVLFWLFSIGLPNTDKPARFTPEQKRAAMASHARAFGRPLLWVFALCSGFMALVGGLAVLFASGERLGGLMGFLFFGACTAVFVRQIRLAGQARTVESSTDDAPPLP
jgi:hypothetical protein